MPVEFTKHNNILIMTYESNPPYIEILHSDFRNNRSPMPRKIKKIYHLSKDQYLKSEILNTYLDHNNAEDYINDERISFKVAYLIDGYFRFDPRIFNGVQLFISSEIEIEDKIFRASRNISIIKKFGHSGFTPVIIGGNKEGAIPLSAYKNLLKNFPTSTELTKYTSYRIASIVKDFFPSAPDWNEQYSAYMDRRSAQHVNHENIDNTVSSLEDLATEEKIMYRYLYNQLLYMLDSPIRYIEKDWQKYITKLILLIFPKYIQVFEEITIKNTFKRRGKLRIDHILVDYDGFIDIVEIKRPDIPCMSRTPYRNNYISGRDLSGTAIQLEKYIQALTKWGTEGEKKLTQTLRGKGLSQDVVLKVSSPRGIVIMGRDVDALPDDSKYDFEIIKRQYKNIFDIITYDDLLRRLKNIIKS